MFSLRLRTVGVAVFGTVAIASAACRGADYDVYVFHGVEGVISLSGNLTGEHLPSSRSVTAGSGSFAPANSRVSLSLGFREGSLHAGVVGAEAPGTYQLDGVLLLFEVADAEGYACRIGCNVCQLTLDEVGPEGVAGDLSCEGLIGCLETGAPCDPNIAPKVDVSASFELSQPTKGLPDY